MDKSGVMRIRDEIILSALPHVPFDGWTHETLALGAAESGHGAAMARAVFPGGIADALDGFADLADRAMLERLGGVDPAALRVRGRVRAALLARYGFLEPHREALRLALSYWALPHRKPLAARLLWRTADRIWTWSGDSSADYNRYTKRALLSAVIASATLAWLGGADGVKPGEHSDKNADKNGGEDTSGLQAFIDRRIENVLQFGKFLGGIRKAS